MKKCSTELLRIFISASFTVIMAVWGAAALAKSVLVMDPKYIRANQGFHRC